MSTGEPLDLDAVHELVLAELPATQPPPIDAWTIDRMAAAIDQIEATKPVVACAPDVYERVRQAVADAGMGAYFRVVEHSGVPDGQVFVATPLMPPLEPPIMFADPAEPGYHCRTCLQPSWLPDRCSMCEGLWKMLTDHRVPQTPFLATPPGI